MASERRTLKIDDLKANQDSAIAIGPFGSRMKADLYVPVGVPVIRGNNLGSSKYLSGEYVFVSEATADQLKSCNVFPGDLVFPHRGAIGEVGIVPTDKFRRFILSTSLMKLSCNRDVVSPLYLYYFFRSPNGKHELLKRSSTVGTPGIGQPLTSLRSIEVSLPEVREQDAVAHILGTLDDKIELNRKMNEKLESMAGALYKSWFVDFDPVRAKVEGRDTGLPAHIAALFPDSFEDSELGEIPKGWTVKSLGNLIELAYGKALKEGDRKPGRVAVYGSNGQIGWHNEKLADGPGIVVGRKGNPGIVTWVPIDFFAIDTTFYVLPKTNCDSLYFLFMALKGHDLASLGADSAVPGLNRNMAYMSKQLVPSLLALQAFDQQVRTLFDRVQNGKEESLSLAALRDALLPRLISGELRPSSASRIAGEGI
jgi:type I restriction enzyme S subunit